MSTPILTVLSCARALPAATARDYLDQAAAFREAVEVRVMDLDVVVTDSKGRPVPDVKQQEFSVKVDGKPVSVESLDAIEPLQRQDGVGKLVGAVLQDRTRQRPRARFARAGQSVPE